MAKTSKKSRNIIGIALVVLIGLIAWSMVSAMGSREKPDDDKHLGIAEYEKGNYQEAIEYYNKGLEARPGDSCLFNNRGLAYYSLEQYNKAVADYNRAIELRSDFVDAYYNRGLAYFRKGSYYNFEPRKKAIDDFTKAIELKPDFVDAYYNRARGCCPRRCVQ
jgi:tetratricopeptide (TPR) repeat protein